MRKNIGLSIFTLILLQVLTLAPFVFASPAAQTDANQSYAIAVFPPKFTFSDTINAVNHADGVIINTGRWHGVSYASSTSADFKKNLYSEGALLVLTPALLTVCTNRKEA